MIELFGFDGLFTGLDLFLINAQWLTETFVEFKRDDGFWQLVQVSAQDIGGIMDGVSGPIQSLSISLGRVKDLLEVLYTFCGSIESKDTFDIRSYKSVSMRECHGGDSREQWRKG